MQLDKLCPNTPPPLQRASVQNKHKSQFIGVSCVGQWPCPNWYVMTPSTVLVFEGVPSPPLTDSLAEIGKREGSSPPARTTMCTQTLCQDLVRSKCADKRTKRVKETSVTHHAWETLNTRHFCRCVNLGHRPSSILNLRFCFFRPSAPPIPQDVVQFLL